MTAPSSATWSLLRVSDIEGRNVIGMNDESIGTVSDVYVDYDEHTVRYCTVDVGGFLGIGAKTVLVPFELLQWSGEDLYLPVDKDALENAPEFDPLAEYDRTYEQTVTTAWGVPTYWTAPTYGTDHSHWRQGYERPSAEFRHDRRSV
ncbi:MAG TPA: PRC-barrel domain-containing protein [Candidatus Limnocylindria bacterium]|nr:PRC-barrel domain-containing protein [Candidatus Limnocylindria bacterium]